MIYINYTAGPHVTSAIWPCICLFLRLKSRLHNVAKSAMIDRNKEIFINVVFHYRIAGLRVYGNESRIMK